MPSSRHTCALGFTRSALAALLLAGLLGHGAPSAAQEAPKRTVVALLPILIHSMESQDFLRAGLADMLQSRLGREAQLAVIPVRDPATATNDLATARSHAGAAGAEYVVYGTFTHFGDGASVDLTCAPVQGDAFGPREVFVHAGTLGGVIPTLDGLMDKVARYIIDGPTELPAQVTLPAAAAQAPGAGDGTPPPGLEALARRVELLEQTLGIESEGGEAVAADDDIEVPGIFQVYDEDTAPN